MNAARVSQVSPPLHPLHPLDPLTADEISHAVTIVRKTRALADDTLFVRVSLHEPPKEIVLGFREGEPLDRQAFLILRDRRARATFEAVVSLGRGIVVSWRDVSGVQPPITIEEFFACERLVRSSSAWLDAVRKRGVADPELAIVDPWSAGYYGPADDPRRRLIAQYLFPGGAKRRQLGSRQRSGVISAIRSTPPSGPKISRPKRRVACATMRATFCGYRTRSRPSFRCVR